VLKNSEKYASPPPGNLLSKSLQEFSQKCLVCLFLHFFMPYLKVGIPSIAAIYMYNATFMHYIIQMKFRHGRHVLAPAHQGTHTEECGVNSGGARRDAAAQTEA
jgi:hypothetical protein